jgi:hypothetical protein
MSRRISLPQKVYSQTRGKESKKERGGREEGKDRGREGGMRKERRKETGIGGKQEMEAEVHNLKTIRNLKHIKRIL